MDDAGELPTIDYKALFERVRLNRDLLDACPRHHFPELAVVPRKLGQKTTCSVCTGQMDMVAINYYVRGYEAGGHSGNDIVPGWKEEPPVDEQPSAPKRSFFAPDE